MAHGIAGVLALLSLAIRAGVQVDGQLDAVARILTWLDRWRLDTDAGPVWPYWVNRAQLRAGRRDITDNTPPSWCYGAVGVARAQQLAALAAGDHARQRLTEHALVQALAAVTLRAGAADATLCHGYAGFALVALAAAADAEPGTARQLDELQPRLLDALRAAPSVRGPGLLEGQAGLGLTELAVHAGAPPVSGWQTCLLIA
ncbi:lanthionine synthetase LanC family protein [Pseudofrankia sp. BMG5.36]|uniref:lanthionine synthetase LanC family protein n=1 Tax=Pseudofrankia sp. BMG5.36 TaxID=1834512 RepID=UPI0008DA9782|nr:lanthionine synthetase LanC family protein [Pseudofrankia sp. BMG5.36]OHV58752.1 hypothetical protein BCD48_42075 [Pseudofrankia sp. BMG5.36]